MNRTKDQIIHDIESVIDKYIKMSVEQHGGQVEVKEFDMDTGKLTMLMKGACSGCAGSTATLQRGIETTMKHYIPEVKQVKYVVNSLKHLDFQRHGFAFHQLTFDDAFLMVECFLCYSIL